MYRTTKMQRKNEDPDSRLAADTDKRNKVIYAACKPAPAASESEGLSVVLGRDDLYTALTTVAPVARGSYSLPVLNNTLLTLETEGRLKVQATNLETTITTWAHPVTVGKTGAISVPCQRLMELVKLLPGGAYVSLATGEGNRLNLTCNAELSAPGRSQRFDVRSKLTGMGVEEYPHIPAVQGRTLAMPGARLAEMLKQVKHYAAQNETRPVLAGVLFEARGEELTLVATDGFGLALATEGTIDMETNLIAPLEVLTAVLRHLRGDEPVEIVFSADAILFRLAKVEIAGRLRDGQYPDYRAVIPQTYVTQALAQRRELLDTLRMAGQFNEANWPVTLSVSGNGNGSGQIKASIDNAVLGDFAGSIPAVVSGAPVEMRFDADLLIKGLAALDAEQVLVGLNSDELPLVFEAGRSKQVVMPCRIKVEK
jgi:DNA polymerase-3 subunit beta